MTGRRVYVTADGRYVPEGDTRGVALAYGIDDDVPDAVTVEGDEKPVKASPKPADKAAAKPATK